MSRLFQIVAAGQSLYGLSVILRTEGISFQRGASQSCAGISLLDVKELSENFELSADCKLFLVLPSDDCLSLRKLAGNTFGIACKSVVAAQKGILRFREGSIFEKEYAHLRSFGFSEVAVPVEEVVECGLESDAQVLAEIEVEGNPFPAVISRDGNFLVTFDLGRSLLSLLTETYCGAKPEEKPLSLVAGFTYRLLPYRLRLEAYRNFLKWTRRRVREASHFTTTSPVDPAGWALSQILISALDHSPCVSPRIWKWPSTYSYAFCFTHDIEPRKYAYYQGLPRLFETLAELNIRSTISVIAEPQFVLPEGALKELPRAGHEIISHGLHHDGTFGTISSGERARQIARSRQKLERVAGTAVKGFRAPWLQRTADLGRLLEDQGISFDSSFVDADTSLKRAWHGKGISFNFPFRLFNLNEGVEEHQVLEMPLTGPQDMEPYFAGLNFEECKTLFEQKHKWVKSITGLYVFLSHAGVYGKEDLEMRMNLLRHLYHLVKGDDVWLARLGDVWEWWTKRESVRIRPSWTDSGKPSFEIENQGRAAVRDFSIAIPSKVLLAKKLAGAIEKNGFFLVPVTELKPLEKIEIGLSGEKR